MFKNNLKNLSCDFADNSIIISRNNKIKACPRFDDFFILDENFQGFSTDNKLLKNNLFSLKTSFSEFKTNDKCKDCYNLHHLKYDNKNTLKRIYLSHWSCCFLNCKYCKRQKYKDIEDTKHFDVLPVLQEMIDNKLLDKNTHIIFDCGDATVHPDFDKLMYFFYNFDTKNITVNTPALRYCQSISDCISKGIVTIIVPFDCGCSYIYEKIKGVNKFDIAVSNIKRYLEYQDENQKRIILKYNLMKSINDNNKEILDWFIFSRNIGINKLILDIDDTWFAEIRNSIPDYLYNLIEFTKELSVLNNYETEFTKKVEYLYNKNNSRMK